MIPTLSHRMLILGFLLMWVTGVYATPTSRDYSKASVSQLIDDLALIDAATPGINSAAIYDGFIANGSRGEFVVGVLGIAPPTVPPQMRELVRRGPLALAELIQHVDDARPTKLEVGNKDSGGTGQVGVDTFMFTYFSDEYDGHFHRWFDFDWKKNPPIHMEKPFKGRYTVKVGDICYVLIGQIVSRRLLAVRYQPSAQLVVNSPIEAPSLAEKVKSDWSNADSEILKASLLADIRRSYDDKLMSYSSLVIDPALERLRLYFPDTYNALKGDDLKKRKEFEKQESKR
jgi:hypothetical protein